MPEVEGAGDIATPDDDAGDDDIFRLRRFDMDLGDSSTVQGCRLLNVQRCNGAPLEQRHSALS